MTRPSFHDLYVTEREFVWRTLRRLGVPERHLEDVAHDVFVTIHRKLGDYDPARPLRPWVFVFVLRTARDFRNEADNARVELRDEPDEFAGKRDVESEVADRQARALVLRALEVLDDEQRAVFVLHDIEEQGMPEIATALGVPLNTAYSRLRLARQKFANAVLALEARKGAEA